MLRPLGFRPGPGPGRPRARLRQPLRNAELQLLPLLLAWLERAHPETYRRILEADRDSSGRLGHGNALAQPYGDAPLPALNLRDKRTALHWGKEDFQRRFGRPPEGLWLPGTAADEETLEALIAEGFRFTVLPSRRAGRVRVAGGAEADWKEVRSETFNPTRPYRWLSRQAPGSELAVFFPHERLGATLASGEALRDAETLWRGVKARFLPDDSTQLVHAANPGELYGLELKGAPGVLGQALRNLEADGLPATNYAAFLDHFPPPQEFELGPADPPQEPAWRSGLRQILQRLAEDLDGFFAERLGAWLCDPWAARDAYAELLGDPSARNADEFLSRRSRRHLKPAEARAALLLFELQRRRLLMLSETDHDCRDITDAEPLQALKQACRAAELAAVLGGPDLRPLLRERLAQVKTASGTPAVRKSVRPAPAEPPIPPAPASEPKPAKLPKPKPRPGSFAFQETAELRRREDPRLTSRESCFGPGRDEEPGLRVLEQSDRQGPPIIEGEAPALRPKILDAAYGDQAHGLGRGGLQGLGHGRSRGLPALEVRDQLAHL